MATGNSEKETDMLGSDKAPEGLGMPDSRVEKPTEKDLEYALNLKRREFRALITEWWRQASHIEVLLSECVASKKLKEEQQQSPPGCYEKGFYCL